MPSCANSTQLLLALDDDRRAVASDSLSPFLICRFHRPGPKGSNGSRRTVTGLGVDPEPLLRHGRGVACDPARCVAALLGWFAQRHVNVPLNQSRLSDRVRQVRPRILDRCFVRELGVSERRLPSRAIRSRSDSAFASSAMSGSRAGEGESFRDCSSPGGLTRRLMKCSFGSRGKRELPG